MNFVEAFRTAAGDANAGLTRLVELMSSERWQPGSETVDEIVTRAGRDIKGVLANVGPFMRLSTTTSRTCGPPTRTTAAATRTRSTDCSTRS